MPDNHGITWASDLHPPRNGAVDDGRIGSGSANWDAEIEGSQADTISQGLGMEYVTQRNTPIALSAKQDVEPVDDDEVAELGHERDWERHHQSRHQRSQQSSTQNSTSSLQQLAESLEEPSPGLQSPGTNRGSLHRSSQSQLRGRKKHSYSLSTSNATPSPSRPNSVHPVYPNQALSAITDFLHAPRPTRPLRTKSSAPSQNLLYNEMSLWTQPAGIERHPGYLHGARTADNTPMSSPGLSTGDRAGSAVSMSDPDNQPWHLQNPTTVGTAAVGVDTYSGRKMINDYEVIKEIGRGEHGKVKLGRNLHTGLEVAIKIVPRFSGKRRLGRLGNPEDRTKREVAILKRARHHNIVSLLEVIDDPNKNKVYLILEFVGKGEIKWRKPGVREILAYNNERFDKERSGIAPPVEPPEQAIFAINQARRYHELKDRVRGVDRGPSTSSWVNHFHGNDLEEEEETEGISPQVSRQHVGESSNPSRAGSNDDYAGATSLAGSMYGSFVPHDDGHMRKYSLAHSVSAFSHMSSEWEFDEHDDEHGYVPAMTLEEARRAFRDTLSGLRFLHSIGIIHRDIKPANLLVSNSGTVKISDFGVSYLGPAKDPEKDSDYKLTENDVSALDDERELARSVGTPAFWAPELCYEDASMFEEKDGPKITGAIDLWALGITLYCMIYARLPFYASATVGLHEAVCTTEVFLPKTRLVPVDTSNERPSAHVPITMNSNKRTDYELKFEVVPEAVRDLIGHLLVKDPKKRMTIDEAKLNTWVVEDLQDPAQWIRGPEMEKEGNKKILEVNTDEITQAVTKLNIIEKAVGYIGDFASTLLRRTGTKKRSGSTATSASQSNDSLTSPSGSSGSTIGVADRPRPGEGRRTSLKSDDLVGALKSSREATEHPLAQSQTASPEASSREHYFGEPDRMTISTANPTTRPAGPDRAHSTMSTADSVKTVRAAEHPNTMQLSPDMHYHEQSPLAERGLAAKMTSIWEESRKRFSSRDRHGQQDDQSPISSRTSSHSEPYAVTSTALSTASAEGEIEPPEALKDTSTGMFDDESRFPTMTMQATSHPPESSTDAFERAQQLNQRRAIQEAHCQAEAAAISASQTHERSMADCPPSPDDFASPTDTKDFANPRELSLGASMLNNSGPSASTIASSIGDYDASSVSQSMSNRSIGVISGASSPPGEGYMSATISPESYVKPSTMTRELEPEFMRTADTITNKRGRATYQVATGRALEDYDAGDDDDVEDDGSDEEEGMMMGGSTSGRKH
jgi:SNF1-activating kinase 1